MTSPLYFTISDHQGNLFEIKLSNVSGAAATMYDVMVWDNGWYYTGSL